MSTNETAVVEHQELLPCGVCGRTFLPGSLAKHSRICERNATRKRKVFDSLKQRVEGTDLAPFHQKSYLKKPEAPQPEPKVRQSKWKEKHLELVNAIRAAKGVSTESSVLKKPSVPLVMSSPNERCPSCDRQFGPKAFDRHVEWCKERKSRIQKSPANILMAKERLEARTKYKVPPLTKSRRTLTREKYSPSMSRTESVTSVKSNSSTSLERSPSVRKPKSVVNLKKSSDKDILHNTKSEKFVREQGDSKCSSEGPKKESIGVEKVTGKDSKKVIATEKSSTMKNIKTKLNPVAVNSEIEGLTVQKISKQSVGEETPKKLVTWKETVMRSNSDNNAMLINVVNSANEPVRKSHSESDDFKYKLSDRSHNKTDYSCKSVSSHKMETSFKNLDSKKKRFEIKKIVKNDSETSLVRPPYYKNKQHDRSKNDSRKYSRESSFSLDAKSDSLSYVDITGPGKSSEKSVNIELLERSIANIIKNDPILQKSRIPIYKESYKSSNQSEFMQSDDDLDSGDNNADDLKLNLRTSKDGAELIEESLKLLQPKKTSKTEIQFFGRKPIVFQQEENERLSKKSVLDKYKIDDDQFMEAYNMPNKKVNVMEMINNDEDEPDVYPGDPCCSYKSEKTTFKALGMKAKLHAPVNSPPSSKSTIKMIIKKNNGLAGEVPKTTFKKIFANQEKMSCSKDNHICSGQRSEKLCEACRREFLNCGIVLKNDISPTVEEFSKIEDTLDEERIDRDVEVIEKDDENIEESIDELQESKVELQKRKDEAVEDIKETFEVDDLAILPPPCDFSDDWCNNLDKSPDETILSQEITNPNNTKKPTINLIKEFKKAFKHDNLQLNLESFASSNLSSDEDSLESPTLNGKNKEFQQKKSKSNTSIIYRKSIDSAKEILERFKSPVIPHSPYSNSYDESKSRYRTKQCKDVTWKDIKNKVDMSDLTTFAPILPTGVISYINHDTHLDYQKSELKKKSSSKKKKSPICLKSCHKKLDENTIKKLNFRKSNVLFLNKHCSQGWELDSLDGETIDPYNEVLSTARVQRRLRKCCSDIGLSRLSEVNFTSYTDINLCKMTNSDETPSKPKISFKQGELKPTLESIKKDKILELAGQKFLASLKSDFDKNAHTSTPKNSLSSCSSDYIPRKRRKLSSINDIGFEEKPFVNIFGSMLEAGDMKRDGQSDNENERIKSVPPFKFGCFNEVPTYYFDRQVRSAHMGEGNFNVEFESETNQYANLLSENIAKIKSKRNQVNYGDVETCWRDPSSTCILTNTVITISEGHFERYFYPSSEFINVDQEESLDKMEEDLSVFKRDIENYSYRSRLNVIDEVSSDKIESSSSGAIVNFQSAGVNLKTNPVDKNSAVDQVIIPSILDYPDTPNVRFYPNHSYRPLSSQSVKTNPLQIRSSSCFSLQSSEKASSTSILTPTTENLISTIYTTSNEELIVPKDSCTSMVNISKHQAKKLLNIKPEKIPTVLVKEEVKLPKLVKSRIPEPIKKKKESGIVSLPSINNHKSEKTSSYKITTSNSNSKLVSTENKKTNLNNNSNNNHMNDIALKTQDSFELHENKGKLRFKNITLAKGNGNADTNTHRFERGDSLECENVEGSFGYSGGSTNDRKKNLNSLKRSISLLDPVANPRSLKSKEDIENYFDEKTQKQNNEKVSDENLKAEDLFQVDSAMYEEYKKYEALYLSEKKGKKINEAVTGSEDDDQLTVKISGDSAYGSLNRKTPKVRARATKLAPLDAKKNFTRVESPSSSGSDTSPTYLQSPTPDNNRLPKFCHECGSKYPVNSAKFCVECGVKRLVL